MCKTDILTGAVEFAETIGKVCDAHLYLDGNISVSGVTDVGRDFKISVVVTDHAQEGGDGT